MRKPVVLLAALWSLSWSCAAQQALDGSERDYDPLLAMIGEARVVLLGEATHGSREFYTERARITRRLIEDSGFTAVILEAPWEPARAIDAYIRGGGGDAATALSGFVRFPRWLWRNGETERFVDSLRALNLTRADDQPPVRLFGMDLYSVPESAEAVVRYLASDPPAAARARQRYVCFANYLEEPMLYGHEVEAGQAESCADGAAAQLTEMAATPRDEAGFAAWQSARVVQGGESYYRALYRKGEISWNWRERHLADTVTQIMDFLGPRAKVVVWAHNSHVGDARATDQAAVGEVSLGQLMRERFGEQVVLVGLSTYRGYLRVAADWGGPDRVRRLRPALHQSWSGQLHRLEMPRSLLIFRGNPALAGPYAAKRLERVIGVAYVSSDERSNHYWHAELSKQFDALVYIDLTQALSSGEAAKKSAKP